MKRDLDLLRELLLFVEEQDDGRGVSFPTSVFSPFYETHTDVVVFGHLKLLAEAGLIEGIVESHGSTGQASFTIMVKRLTIYGHDYLDTIRDNDVWKSTKDVAVKAGGWTLSLLGDIATSLVKAKLAELGVPVS